MHTTLKKIREKQPCTHGWVMLLKGLNKEKADDERLSIISIIDSNGIEDAIWCLRAVEGYDKEIKLFAIWCARQVQHLMTDPRSNSALDVAEKFLQGDASIEEFSAAKDAAWDAVRDAKNAACDAVRDARDAAWVAAWAAACWDARDAAGAAAWAAACWDARDAAWAAGDAQEKRLRDICEQINNQEQK